jgi:hypothetical protein
VGAVAVKVAEGAAMQTLKALLRWFNSLPTSTVLVAVIVAFIVYTVFFTQVLDTRPLPAPVGGKDEIKVVAREPGVDYDVAAFCADPATRVVLGVLLEVPGTNYMALRGQESVNWKDTDPPGSNPNAIHYWIGPEGLQHSEEVEVTKPAADCLKKKLQR